MTLENNIYINIFLFTGQQFAVALRIGWKTHIFLLYRTAIKLLTF